MRMRAGSRYSGIELSTATSGTAVDENVVFETPDQLPADAPTVVVRLQETTGIIFL
jgi:hypothetical protein